MTFARIVGRWATARPGADGSANHIGTGAERSEVRSRMGLARVVGRAALAACSGITAHIDVPDRTAVSPASRLSSDVIGTLFRRQSAVRFA